MLYVAELSLRDLSKRFYNNKNRLEDYAITIATIRNLLIIIKTQGRVLPG